jgi:ComF family protein
VISVVFKLAAFFKNIFYAVVNYLMPASCFACRSLVWSAGGLCSVCWQKCVFIKDLNCIKCGRLARYQGLICGFCIKEPPFYDSARSLIDFNFVSKRFIHDLKYGDRTDLIHFFAKLLASSYSDFIADIDIIIPIPMHFFRRMIRSYNQAQLLAIALSCQTKKKFAPFILKKSKFTRTQSSLNRKERKQNLKGSFEVNKIEDLKGKNVLLVDDVMTTGSTVNVCSKALKESGAMSVKVLTIASVR